MYNKNLSKTMKATREFSISDGVIEMRTVFFPEDDSLDFPFRLKIKAIINPLEDLSFDSCPFPLFLDCASDVPLDLRISEMQFFTTLLHRMYLTV